MKHTVKEVTLKNGSKGLLINVPNAQVMTFEFNFRAGEYLVEPDKWETAHLMEHLLLGANQEIRTARAFQAELERNGAYANASTNVYHITYEAECADFEWRRVLELLLLAISKPLFLETEFQAEMGSVREELFVRGNNHFRHLSLALRQAYGMLAKTDQQRLPLLANVTLDDVRKHYKATHTTSNLRFVVAGDLQSRQEQIIKLLEAIDMPAGEGRTPLPEERAHKLDEPLFIPNKTVDNMHFYVDTFYLGKIEEVEWDAMTLLNNMLTETFHSRIYGTARERGIVYAMGSGLDQTRDMVGWWFGAQVTKANAPSLLRLIKREVGLVKRGSVKLSDVKDAKQYALGRYQRSAQTVAGVGHGYSARYFFEDIIEDYYAVPERINAVAKADIIRTANKMFQDNTWGFGMLGKGSQALANRLAKQLSSLWE